MTSRPDAMSRNSPVPEEHWSSSAEPLAVTRRGKAFTSGVKEIGLPGSVRRKHRNPGVAATARTGVTVR
ncbi:hypothetical protein ACFOSC_12560 [Streptantibioticus rubrisoli]|uniref:Uncharacterized protein n=1 Tax=Streptantibioticus rubrisoli TaxID=1387313 RepID=A0ABT1P844_9ACTN|nr:hypothetical protein [Streptantibioticus rubrisoli]MCQ4041539.1 hypothetical protein [Streptantibioticus rubrisoli]